MLNANCFKINDIKHNPNDTIQHIFFINDNNQSLQSRLINDFASGRDKISKLKVNPLFSKMHHDNSQGKMLEKHVYQESVINNGNNNGYTTIITKKSPNVKPNTLPLTKLLLNEFVHDLSKKKT